MITTPHYLDLHIGLNVPGKAWERVCKEQVIEFLAARFESFTVTDALGVFRGEREPALVVGIAVDDPQQVVDAAAALRARFGWEGVGIVFESKYYRATADQTPVLTPKKRISKESAGIRKAEV